MLAPIRANRQLAVIMVAAVLLVVATTQIVAVVYPFATPVFGLTMSRDGKLLAADAGSGIFEIHNGQFTQIAHLPGVTDVASIRPGEMFAVTSAGFGGEGKLYQVSGGSVREIADLLEFESVVNPDGGIIESNPFDVAVLAGTGALVADAAGNSLLVVDRRGNVDWVATVPDQVVSTDTVKEIFGCPESGAPVCGLPAQMLVQAVATSVAIGPDGAYYVGELKGFPAPTGASRVWRIEPGTRTRCAEAARHVRWWPTASPRSSTSQLVPTVGSTSWSSMRQVGWRWNPGREWEGL